MPTTYDEQIELWQGLYDKVCDVLELFGTEDSHRQGDFWVHDNYWGHPQIKIYVHNLTLLKPEVVKLLRGTLVEFPGWEIVLAVANLDEGKAWPEMGLIIRSHEIIDGLQRRYFSREFQNIRYEGSKPGTDRD